MTERFTEIVQILDRSGSMAGIANDAIGGFNNFLTEQRNHPGKATMTLIQFDTEYEVLQENTPLEDVPELTSSSFRPRGMTALLDAIGRTIQTVGKRLSRLEESARPDKVVVSILTDGEENSSTEFSLSQIREMIEHQRNNYQWEFIFLGANQDAFAEGIKLGIKAADTAGFAPTSKGIQDAYRNISSSTINYRTN